LHVPPMIWVKLSFEPNSVCIVLASAFYVESDYYRDYDEFLAASGGQRG
jgi:hypothetical protein